MRTAVGLVLVVAVFSGCDPGPAGSVELLTHPAAENSPAALLTGTAEVSGGCLRVTSQDSPGQSWAPVFSDDLEVAVVDGVLMAGGRSLSRVDRRDVTLYLGGGQLPDSQTREIVSGPIERSCNGGPYWRVTWIDTEAP